MQTVKKYPGLTKSSSLANISLGHHIYFQVYLFPVLLFFLSSSLTFPRWWSLEVANFVAEAKMELVMSSWNYFLLKLLLKIWVQLKLWNWYELELNWNSDLNWV